MATTKQKKIARMIIDNAKLDKPLTYGQMLEKVSYSKGIQQQPSRIIKAQGVQDELAILGFNELSAKKVVEEIMLDKTVDANARLKATDQVFKVVGSYAPERSINLNLKPNPEVEEQVAAALKSFIHENSSSNT